MLLIVLLRLINNHVFILWSRWNLVLNVLLPSVNDENHYVYEMEELKFKPGQVHRSFVHVPEGATWAGNTDHSDKCFTTDFKVKTEFVSFGIHANWRSSGWDVFLLTFAALTFFSFSYILDTQPHGIAKVTFDLFFLFWSTEFSVSSLEKEVNGRFLLHALQLSPLSSYKEHEYSQFFTLSPLGEKTLSFAVKVKTHFYV